MQVYIQANTRKYVTQFQLFLLSSIVVLLVDFINL